MKYDPKALYYALQPIKRTRATVEGEPQDAAGAIRVEPAVLDADGYPVLGSQLFTMEDRTTDQIEPLVKSNVIALVPTKKK